MRHSRVKIQKEYFGKKLLITILFLIILPAVSIVPGYLGAKYFVIPYFFSGNSSTSENEIEIQDVGQNSTPIIEEAPQIQSQNPQDIVAGSLELSGFDIFSIQVGSFSTKENAEALVQELEQKKMGAYLYENHGFKVITLSLLERTQVDATIPTIINNYEGAFVVPISIPQKSLEYLEGERPYLELLKIQNDRMRQVLSVFSDCVYQFKNNLINKDSFLIKINQVKGDAYVIKENLSSIEPSPRFLPLHQEFMNLISSIIEDTEQSNTISEEVLVAHNETALTKGLYSLMKIYTEF